MISKAIPQLPLLDLDRSKAFYEKKLGFKCHREYDGFLIFTKDIELHLWLCDNPVVPQSSSAYFRVTEIENLYESCDRLGIVHPRAHLADKPWGIKEFYSIDPDQNLLKFGQFSLTFSYTH